MPDQNSPVLFSNPIDDMLVAKHMYPVENMGKLKKRFHAYPWKDIEAGTYLYRRPDPDWDQPAKVTVEIIDGEFIVRSAPRFSPDKLKNFPSDATFERVADPI